MEEIMPKHKVRSKFPGIGDVLKHKYKGKVYTAEITAVDPKSSKIELIVNRRSYGSLSAAAKGITGFSHNGWLFWRLDKPKSK